jgi:hypothetical protein
MQTTTTESTIRDYMTIDFMDAFYQHTDRLIAKDAALATYSRDLQHAAIDIVAEMYAEEHPGSDEQIAIDLMCIGPRALAARCAGSYKDAHQ